MRRGLGGGEASSVCHRPGSPPASPLPGTPQSGRPSPAGALRPRCTEIRGGLCAWGLGLGGGPGGGEETRGGAQPPKFGQQFLLACMPCPDRGWIRNGHPGAAGTEARSGYPRGIRSSSGRGARSCGKCAVEEEGPPLSSAPAPLSSPQLLGISPLPYSQGQGFLEHLTALGPHQLSLAPHLVLQVGTATANPNPNPADP